VLLTYPLQLFPCLELMQPQTANFTAVPNNDDNDLDLCAEDPIAPLEINTPIGTLETASTTTTTTRIALVLLTYVIAVVVPNVQTLISLAGALAGSSTALLLPPLLDLAWLQNYSNSSSSNWHCIKSYVLLAGGVLFLCIGTTASILDIIRVYRS
jgi:hypothetical protein